MPIESFGNIDDLDPDNPLVDDPVSEGDDHIRGLKLSLQGNVQGDETFTALLADGFIAALVDALAFTVKAAPMIDLDRSVETEQTLIRLRNAAGGWQLNTFIGSGDMIFQETDEAGVVIQIAWQALKGAEFSAFFANSLAFSTIDPTRNSSAEVYDVNGTARPIGYNTLPPTTVPTSTTAINDHNGHTIDVTGNGISYTLADLYAGWTVNVLCSNAGGAGIVVPSGLSLNLYEGGQLRTFGGPSTLAMNRGSALTITQRAANSFNAWGGNVA